MKLDHGQAILLCNLRRREIERLQRRVEQLEADLLEANQHLFDVRYTEGLYRGRCEVYERFLGEEKPS